MVQATGNAGRLPHAAMNAARRRGLVHDANHERNPRRTLVFGIQDYARELFAKMGFESMECEMRARMYVTVISQESSIMCALPQNMKAEFNEVRHRFFTRPLDNERET